MLIETIAGYYKIREILSSSKRITAVALGVEDIVAECGIERGRLSDNPILNHMLVELAISAHMFGIQCFGPITRGYGKNEYLKDLEDECIYLKMMNFQGKAAIHPSHIQIINRIFDITDEDIEKARLYISMFCDSEDTDGTAIIVKDNQMEDLPSLTKAINLIKYAREHGFINKNN